MTERSKKIIALTLASSMIISLTGCKNYKQIDKTKQERTDVKNIDNHYVVVLKVDDQYKVYLTTEVKGTHYISVKNNEIIVTKREDNICISDNGRVNGIYPFSVYFDDYKKGKSYNVADINEIFNSIVASYETRNKKLVLK